MAISQAAERLEALASQIRSCVQCPLHATRTKAVPGEGAPSARVMLIGEAPGGEEDKRGQPFVGAAGRFLDEQDRGAIAAERRFDAVHRRVVYLLEENWRGEVAR